MRCPVCHLAIPEQAPECVHCGFHLAQADRLFGCVPVLNSTLHDFAQVLSQKDQNRIFAAVADFEHRFPQLRLAVILTRLPKGAPFTAYLHWLFNRGNLAPQLESGTQCRLVLLGIDANLKRALCMIGYGLEPFIHEAVLQHIADSTIPHLKTNDYVKAVTAAIEEADNQFTTICQSLPRIYGLHADDEKDPAWPGAADIAY